MLILRESIWRGARTISCSRMLVVLMLMLSGGAQIRGQKPELVFETGHTHLVRYVAINSEGNLLASGEDNTVKIWDVRSGRVLRTFSGFQQRVSSVAFSPDGRLLASGSDDKSIRVWHVISGRFIGTLRGHASGISAVTFVAEGKMLASAGWDHMIKLWDLTNGHLIRTIDTQTAVNSLTATSKGSLLASGGSDGALRVWDVQTGSAMQIFQTDQHRITSVAFSADEKLLASSDDKTVKVWDATTGKTIVAINASGESVAFTRDGRFLVGANIFHIKKWDVTTGTSVQAVPRSSSVSQPPLLAVSGDGSSFAVPAGQGLELWNVADLKVLRTFNGHRGLIASVILNPDGTKLASASHDAPIRVWDLKNARDLIAFVHPPEAEVIAFSPTEDTLASGSFQSVKLWDLASAQEKKTLSGHSSWVRSVTFSHDGKILASSGDDGVRLWDVATGNQLQSLPTAQSLAFNSSDTLLAGSTGAEIKLWKVPSGNQTELRLSGDSSKIDQVVFVNDTTLAGVRSNAVKFWDTRHGQEVGTIVSGSGEITSVSCSGGTLSALSLVDGQIKVLDVNSVSGVCSTNWNSKTRTLTYTASGRVVVTGGWDTKIKVWDAVSGKELASLVAIDQNDWVVATPDGLFDGSARSWNEISWRFNNNIFDHAPVEAFFNEFYYPGLLADIFAGKRPKAPSDISQKDRRQPQLKLTAADAHADKSLFERTLKVKIDVTESAADKDHQVGSGAQDIRLFRNGSLVRVWRGDVLKGQSSVKLEAIIPIVAGENRLSAYAFNHDNIKSSDATVTVTGAESLRRQGTAYVLAIGVNRYSNQQYNLKYAVPDAEDFAAEVRRQQESLKRYATVEVIALSNQQATKANITEKLAALAKKVQPEDAVIVFFAGHGTAQGNQFYLIPHDLGYAGPREKLTEEGLRMILARSISDRELEKLFEGIDAGQLLLVIDACNSGQALEAEEKRRGPMNSKGLAQLAYEKGMYVLTAAQSYQAAMEASKFGHGFLTYALVEEGLKKGSADREPKNGAIDIREWLNFATDEVPKMQEQSSLDALRGRNRYVVFVGDGREVGLPKTESGARDNVQRPRVFYRRELESNPLVVATVPAKSAQ